MEKIIIIIIKTTTNKQKEKKQKKEKILPFPTMYLYKTGFFAYNST